MAIVHVGTVGAEGKTASIMILGDGCINRILYPGLLGLWGDLVTKLGCGDVFLSLSLGNIVEGRLIGYGSVW